MQRFWWMAVPFILAMTGILLTRGECGHGQPPKDKYAEHIAPTGPRTPEEERKAFHLPPGFEIQLVASEPEIKKPINIAFDARGPLLGFAGSFLDALELRKGRVCGDAELREPSCLRQHLPLE